MKSLFCPQLWTVVTYGWLSFALCAAEPVLIHVSPDGLDANSGTAAAPFATLARAQMAARPFAGKQPIQVRVQGGIYYLRETLVFKAEDSGTREAPVEYVAMNAQKPVLSGGVRLTLNWTPYRDGIVQAKTPLGLEMDQLFLDGRRQPMARYPNYSAEARHFNGSAADAISPARVARWSSPAGGYVHAMHNALWGDMHWRILGKKTDGSLEMEGGWQNNRPSPMHPEFRFVENIFEELDSPGEWYHNAKDGILYLWPPRGTDLSRVVVEVVRLRHLMEFRGSPQQPVRWITLRGLSFRHAARTFMENREPLLRSDWTVYRGGAVVSTGAEDIAIEDCEFDQVGGNTVFVNKYNRRIAVRRCVLRESGANGVAFVGDPDAVRSPLFNYGTPFEYEKLDRTAGPKTENYPADCVVEDCVIQRTGRYEKQTAPVQISMAQRITVRHCSIFEVPRAGINIGDGCWGGHVIEGCDVFDTVLETGDHGSFNSWGRDRYWHPDVRLVDREVARDPTLPFLDMVEPIVLRNNRWRCDHGWDVDLDDGSSRYYIYNNLMLQGGLKLREGYGRVATNNVIVGNSLHPHVWFAESGDVFSGNIVMGAYQPAIMNVPRWGKEIDRNLFTTTEADRTRFSAQGCDGNSLVGDARFVNPEAGDFRVREGSPALALGFCNFPMDNFGVRPERLRALAKAPAIPRLKGAASEGDRGETEVWFRGARLRGLVHYEFSALGVAADAGGALVVEVRPESAAAQAGLAKGDLVQKVGNVVVKRPSDMAREQIPGDVRVEGIRKQERFSVFVSGGNQSK